MTPSNIITIPNYTERRFIKSLREFVRIECKKHRIAFSLRRYIYRSFTAKASPLTQDEVRRLHNWINLYMKSYHYRSKYETYISLGLENIEKISNFKENSLCNSCPFRPGSL